MAKIELECKHDVQGILWLTTVIQNVINGNRVIIACSEVYGWLSEFLLFIHLRQIFVVNLIIKSFAIIFNMNENISHGCRCDLEQCSLIS